MPHAKNFQCAQEAQLMLTNPRDRFRGQSRSPKVPFHMLGTVSSCATVTLSLRHSTSKNVTTLKSGSEATRGHWKWYHSIDCVYFLLVFYREFARKTNFWDIWLQKYRDLENWVMGPTRSLEMLQCDRVHVTSYWHMALSRVVSEIFNVEKCRDLEIRVIGHPRSLKMVPCDRFCMVSYPVSVL